jgi:hypothetical protein
MSLLEPAPEPPKRQRALAFTAGVCIVIAVIFIYFVLRFYPEKRAVETFFNAVVAGDMNHAYQLWQPSASYRLKDFVDDWGPAGYYGPVKSYRIIKTRYPPGPGTSTVEVRVALSPFAPMPDANDAEKSQKTKVVDLWVDTASKSLSVAPP